MTAKEINNIVWKACDSFRGTTNSQGYKDYILTMLFIKFLSDLWDEKIEKLTTDYKGDLVRVERALRNERFVLPEVSRFSYFYKNRNADNIGEIINIGLTELEAENREKLQGVFRNIDYNSEAELGKVAERNRTLRNFLSDFNGLDLKPSHLDSQDVIGDAYEFLISNFASDGGKKAGEFYTPSKVSELLAKLVKPEPGDRICDPACGSASLLIKVAREVGNQNFSLYGQEKIGSTWALARMNMFLHNLDQARIEWGDTLNNPQLLENDELMRFNVVVANPPFSLDKWGGETASSDRFNRYWRGVPPKSKGDWAFISHMVETTYPHKGRVGVIVPHGVLFRGSSEGTIRTKMIDENLLEAVIGLPANVFFGTGIPVAILILNRAKGNNTDVLFIDASREFEAGKNQNVIRDQDIMHILDTYDSFKAADFLDESGPGVVIEEKYAYRATLADIITNGYNLNIPRYVDTFEEEELVDIGAVNTEIAQLKTDIAANELLMDEYLKKLGL